MLQLREHTRRARAHRQRVPHLRMPTRRARGHCMRASATLSSRATGEGPAFAVIPAKAGTQLRLLHRRPEAANPSRPGSPLEGERAPASRAGAPGGATTAPANPPVGATGVATRTNATPPPARAPCHPEPTARDLLCAVIPAQAGTRLCPSDPQLCPSNPHPCPFLAHSCPSERQRCPFYRQRCRFFRHRDRRKGATPPL